MRNIKRFFCLLLSCVSVFCVVSLASPAAIAKSSSDKAVTQQDGRARLNNGKIREKITDVTNFLGIKRFNIKFDDRLDKIVDNIYEDSNFDVRVYTENVSDFLWLSRSVARRLDYPVGEYQKKLNDYAAKLTKDGKDSAAKAVRLISVSLGMVESIYIRSIPTNKSGIYNLALELVYFDGSSDTIDIDSVYNSNKGSIIANNGKGVLGLGYDLDTKNFVLNTPVDVWMRTLGFCRMYDFAANYLLFALYDYETLRFKFEYDNRDWMIQLWKGQYFVTNGAEIGTYTKPKYRPVEFYDCAGDEDMIQMSLEVYHDDELLLSRDKQYHWWINGFSLDDRYYEGDDLTLKGTLWMKDAQMLEAFKKALDKEDELTYSVKGLAVSLVW